MKEGRGKGPLTQIRGSAPAQNAREKTFLGTAPQKRGEDLSGTDMYHLEIAIPCSRPNYPIPELVASNPGIGKMSIKCLEISHKMANDNNYLHQSIYSEILQ